MTTVSTFEDLQQHLGSRRSCLTIGVFDGVHLGHQALIEKAVASAGINNHTSVAVTFRNHPLSVLAPPYTPKRLVTSARKADLLHQMGISVVLLMEFTRELASTPPQEFISRYLVDLAHVHTLACGYDFTFGCQGAGNLSTLAKTGEARGFNVETVPAVSHENRVIKSTHIRDLLFAGHVSEAAKLLSRPHEIPGTVVSGMQRGRTIGFPTANLQWPEDYQVPAKGVYLCGARLAQQDQLWPAMVNIGTSPTFGTNHQTIEAHLLTFSGELHGLPISLFFIERLRDERKFPSVDALVEQLQKDREQSTSLWGSDAIQEIVKRIPGPVDHSTFTG